MSCIQKLGGGPEELFSIPPRSATSFSDITFDRFARTSKVCSPDPKESPASLYTLAHTHSFTAEIQPSGSSPSDSDGDPVWTLSSSQIITSPTEHFYGANQPSTLHTCATSGYPTHKGFDQAGGLIDRR